MKDMFCYIVQNSLLANEYGVNYPSIWIKFSDDILNWEDKESILLLTGRQDFMGREDWRQYSSSEN